MPIMTTFNYEEDMKILLAEEANEVQDIKANFEVLSNEDKIALKSIYDFEYVNTMMIHHYLNSIFTADYSFINRLRKYIDMGFIKSYYLLFQDGERTSNIHIITGETRKIIEKHFALDITSEIVNEEPQNKDILYILKKLALNQFLIGGENIIRKYELSDNSYIDYLVYYENSQIEFYVKVLRFNNRNEEDMGEAIKYVNSSSKKKKKIIFIFEDIYHLEENAGRFLLPKYREHILFQLDCMVVDFPDSFITVDFLSDAETQYGEIKIRDLI
ncbi:MAG: hypothetical protein AB7V48_00640 [Sedimentibacter sp.]